MANLGNLPLERHVPPTAQTHTPSLTVVHPVTGFQGRSFYLVVDFVAADPVKLQRVTGGDEARGSRHMPMRS